ncbi:uncharacterized protein LOC108092294 [Drosophila ficusphila]|uniref:uncharacterized protein LOC108092294 n=1 Tax=Drosophila ficusphila TaxID=30025 RepID=UPI001C8A3A2C|nr:uncharacterized protein LOC108092294 [Drosophila ficusphila]
MSTKADKQLGAVALKVREGYSNLWPKIRASLQYVYKHHFQNYDWFLKADDDTLKYKQITRSVTADLSLKELSQLLEIVNENVNSFESHHFDLINYKSPHFDVFTYESPEIYGERSLWLLRTFCTRLQHLKMIIVRPRWNDLLQLKSLTSLHVQLQFSRAEMCMNFVLSLVELPCLRKLNLEAENYSGDGLHVLEKLESLAIGAYPGINAECLGTACLKMKQLRHLDMGKCIENLTGDNLRVIVRNCRNLESLLLNTVMDRNVPYEIVCQLPKLKYLQIWPLGFLRAGFIEGLIHKTDTPLESLILKGDVLRAEQVEHICEISSLRELFLGCESIPLSGLLKLRNLEILNLTTSEITNHQLLTILEGCPLIRVVGLDARILINSDFVRDATRL